MPNQLEDLDVMLSKVKRGLASDMDSIKQYEGEGITPTGVINVVGFNTKKEDTPKQAPLNYSPVKEVLPLPKSTGFDDPSKVFMPSAQPASVVGAKTADFSGYDGLEDQIKKMKRDTSTADLIAIAASTGLGALFGQVGVGAASAGKYGLERAKSTEQRNESLDDMILKLQAARAAQMGKSSKGTKVGGGGDDPTKNRYIDSQGNLRTPTRKRENGDWAQLESDPIYRIPSNQVVDLKTPEGLVNQNIIRGTQTQSVGQLNPAMSFQTNAKGETVPLNPRAQGTMPEDFNKTSADLSPYSSKTYQAIQNKKLSDPILRKSEEAYSDVKSGMAGLQQGGIAGAKIASKMFASALEKGNRTTDFDVKYAQELDPGLAEKINNWVKKAREGEKLPENIRAELEQGFAVLEAGLADLHGRKTAEFNNSAKNLIKAEWNDGLAFPPLSRFGRKEQTKLTDRALQNEQAWNSTQSWTADWIVNGKPVIDPQSGLPKKAVYIMRAGKPYAVREAR